MIISVSNHRADTCYFIFFFNDTAPTEIYTLSLHDALPILNAFGLAKKLGETGALGLTLTSFNYGEIPITTTERSEEHTSELQSHHDLVCRLLLEKKKTSKLDKKAEASENLKY